MKTVYLLNSGFQLTVRLPEIIIVLLGAIILGFTLHYFWNARRAYRIENADPEEGISENDNWKLKYYNDMDMQEKIQDHLRTQIAELKEAEQISNIELEELRKTYLELRNKPVEELPAKAPNTADEYMSQLRSAQENLFQHNQHINRLLEQIQLLKESEKKLVDLQRTNDQLTLQVGSMQKQLAVKDAEMNQMRQQQRLTDELKERLDKVYSEYSTLQGKMQKLEGYLSQPHSKTIEYDELHDSYFRLSKEYDEVKNRHSALWEENQRLSRILSDTEDKLREANFQRQQFQKKTAFLEDLNKDLQEAAEYSKKLESQIKRISEMESMLGRSKGERHDL